MVHNCNSYIYIERERERERLHVMSEGLRNLLPCGKKLVIKHVPDRVDQFVLAVLLTAPPEL